MTCAAHLTCTFDPDLSLTLSYNLQIQIDVCQIKVGITTVKYCSSGFRIMTIIQPCTFGKVCVCGGGGGIIAQYLLSVQLVKVF